MKNLVKVFVCLFVLMCVQYAQARTITIYNQFSEQLTLSSGMIGMRVKKNDSSFENTYHVVIPAVQSTGVSIPVILFDMPTFAFGLGLASTIKKLNEKISIPAGNDNILVDIDQSGHEIKILPAAARRIITIYNRFSEPFRIKIEGNDPSFEQARKTVVGAAVRSLINGPNAGATTLLGNMPSMPFVLEFVTVMGDSQKVNVPAGDKNMGIDIDQSGHIRSVFTSQGLNAFEIIGEDFIQGGKNLGDALTGKY